MKGEQQIWDAWQKMHKAQQKASDWLLETILAKQLNGRTLSEFRRDEWCDKHGIKRPKRPKRSDD